MSGLARLAVETPRDVGVESDGPGFDLVVADASWIWTQRLFSPLAELGVRVLLFKACDWRTAMNQKRPWGDWLCPIRRDGDHLWQRQFVLPPGWMKTYPRIGMRPLAWAARQWHRSLDRPRPLALAISYPHYLYLRDLLRPSSLLYYNMDDYGFYWSAREGAIRRLEQQTVQQADLSVFCAKVRAEEWREKTPEAADRIVHLPHGAPGSAIPSAPRPRPGPTPEDLANRPRPYLGFVGSLEDRLDWPLVARVADAFPGGTIVLVGREPEPTKAAWYAAYRAAVARPNIVRLGWKSQDEIARYNASFDVCLIPYDTEHAFNHASCPTKVMDYMATTRPVVSTAVPECRLHDRLFAVADSHEDFVTAINAIVARGSDDGLATERWRFARDWTWEKAAAELLRRFQSAIAKSPG